ncbi:MAG: diaminopimelate decarboxylase [Clostridia bacterium]|nr:MAG: diaminopimelate decarboxylase [Clostridia bacterium]
MQVNEKGHLLLGGCDAVDLAGEFGTPLYVIDEAAVRRNCRLFRQAFPRVIYASKALMTMAICRLVEEEGLCLDVVSGGELYTALAAGFPPERIYFHGNNKSRDELALALEAGVGQIVVDNFWELELLAGLTEGMGRGADIFLRVTPGIEAHTHEYIKTGQIDSKFGFTLPGGQALQAVKAVADIPGLRLRGLHSHIGSQVFQVQPYAEAAGVLMDFLDEVRENTGLVLEEINLGGGFGIYYVPGDAPLPPAVYGQAVQAVVGEKAREYGLPEPRVAVEPGRSIVGPAGTTLYTVGSIKEITGVRRYVAVDGGMADNIRPALYQARYRAVLANRVYDGPQEVVSITGKCCESGDMLIWDAELPALKPGDLVAVLCTGAYGYSMASNYNRLPRPAMVLVRDGQADRIVRRETYQDLVSHDVMPARLRTGS